MAGVPESTRSANQLFIEATFDACLSFASGRNHRGRAQQCAVSLRRHGRTSHRDTAVFHSAGIIRQRPPYAGKMSRPTPWRTDRIPPGPSRPTGAVPQRYLPREDEWKAALASGSRRVRQIDSVLRPLVIRIAKSPRLQGQWGYVGSIVALVTVFALLFPQWLSAQGPNGYAATNAFGRIIVSTRYLNAWSRGNIPRSAIPISGAYAVAVTAAVLVTIGFISAYLWTRSLLFARMATIGSLAVVVAVLANMIYFSTLITPLRDLVKRHYDAGGQMASIVNWFVSDGKMPMPGSADSETVTNASFQFPAIAALAITIATAITILVLSREAWAQLGSLQAVLDRLRDVRDAEESDVAGAPSSPKQ